MWFKNIEIVDFFDHLCKPDVVISEVKKEFNNASKRMQVES